MRVPTNNVDSAIVRDKWGETNQGNSPGCGGSPFFVFEIIDAGEK